jgi:hypothetical protein
VTAMTMTKQRLGSPPRSGDVNSSGIIPYLNLSPSYRDAIETVRRLSQLPDDWDSYGSGPLEPAAVEAAANALGTASRSGLPAPFVGPVSGGGLQFEWTLRDHEVELEVLPDGTLRYLIVPRSDAEEEGRIPESDLRGLFDRVRRGEMVAA